jgi:hypothetical protein
MRLNDKLYVGNLGTIGNTQHSNGHTPGTDVYKGKVKVKVKFSLEQATKAKKGTIVIALFFL